jgi:hypothetical protein
MRKFKVDRHFGGTCRLHLKDEADFLLRWFFHLADGPDGPPKRQLTFNGLHVLYLNRQNSPV